MRRQYFGHRHAETDSYVFAVFKQDAHVIAWALPTLAGAIDVPAPAHEHMSGQRATAGEVDQDPFAAGVDAVDGLACQRRIVVEPGEQRVGGSKASYLLAYQGTAQSPGAVRKIVSPSGMGYCTSPASCSVR